MSHKNFCPERTIFITIFGIVIWIFDQFVMQFNGIIPSPLPLDSQSYMTTVLLFSHHASNEVTKLKQINTAKHNQYLAGCHRGKVIKNSSPEKRYHIALVYQPNEYILFTLILPKQTTDLLTVIHRAQICQLKAQ